MRTVGLLGGSFDPPHVGHVLLGATALSLAPIDELWILPAYAHPFGKALSSFEDRVAMTELAFGDLARSRVSRIEQELGGVSYTVQTLEALRARHPGHRWRLIVGTDVARDLPRWHRSEHVIALAPPFVVGRGAHEATSDVELTLPVVSSTEVRARLAGGGDVHSLLPRTVADFVRARGLYRAGTT